jgi:Phospholipase_D-nuclease N-terminal
VNTIVPPVFVLFFLLFVVGGLAVMIWALVDAARMPNDQAFKTGTQLVWILVILLAQGIGAIVYLLVGRPAGGATGARQRALAAPPPVPPPPPGGAL